MKINNFNTMLQRRSVGLGRIGPSRRTLPVPLLSPSSHSKPRHVAALRWVPPSRTVTSSGNSAAQQSTEGGEEKHTERAEQANSRDEGSSKQQEDPAAVENTTAEVTEEDAAWCEQPAHTSHSTCKSTSASAGTPECRPAQHCFQC